MTRIARPFMYALRALNILSLVAGLIGSPVSHAVEIKLNRSLRMSMVSNENGKAESAVGLLKAGSIVDVPDAFRVKNAKGETDAELTLNNWLKTAGQIGYKQEKRAGGVVMKNDTHIDYFYPIKVVRAAEGSNLPTYKGKSYFMALRMLRQTPSGLMVTEDAPLEDLEASPVTLREIEGRACAEGRCGNARPGAITELVNDLKPALVAAEQKRGLTARRTSLDFEKLREKFRNSCGFSLDSYVPLVKKRAASAGIPADILLSIMVQESSGRCWARNVNGDSSRDSGLFGANSNTARMRHCTNAEIEIMRNSRVADLDRGPRCIENPAINLDQAVKTLLDKADALTSDLRIGRTRLKGFEDDRLRDSKGQLTRDGWRLAVSAYNGGERWVLQAKSDLESFNRRRGTRLDPYKWEDLRLFYLRSSLDGSQQEDHFGSAREGRWTRNSILNLAYTENVVPRRRSSPREAMTIAEHWRGYGTKL